ncbi:MAG: GGDEF domain-containing protein [Burkholderiaceae bacterium]|nr:GGDEF domain-containing protein [Burkholderiaceae bacterium]
MLKTLLLRLGLWPMMAGVTLLSIVASVLMASGLTYDVFGGTMGLSAWVITLATPAIIAPVMSFFTFRLVLQLETARMELQHAVHHDPLTELHNRRFFMQALQNEIDHARSGGSAFAVALLDVDNFKSINDRHGHLGGDAVLRQIAQACRAHTHGSDVFARIGGEEFAMLMRHSGLEEARECAERLLHTLRHLEIALHDGVLAVSASIGLTVYQPETAHLNILLRLADQALYAAKREGKDRVAVQLAASPAPSAESPT